ncbi:30S ribosomal protein S15 [Candidatus Gottesmanbacteria bacterium]|nr:30S ribosomal protein S15 [Candidatus Gottesmanbacteria bacterium]
MPAKRSSKEKTTRKVVKTKPAKKIEAKKPTKQAKTVVVPPPSEEKQEIIKAFQVKAGDTGSPEVQVALLTKRIEKLVGHLKANPSDNHSRRGLLGIVSKRRRLLHYLEQKDQKRYKSISLKLELSK